MGAFLDSLDIANRALDHLGLPHILSVDEASDRNSTLSNAYDKMREAELERNIWKFAKRKVYLRPVDDTTRLLAPQAWNINETYVPGSIVSDANGDFWISWLADNYGNEPGVTDAWDSYFGPLAIQKFATGTAYYAGELVWDAGPYAGSFVIYLSTAQGNSDTPSTGTAWDAAVTYGLNDRALSGGFMWRSLLTNNLNLTPAQPPNNYSDAVTYNAADTTVASDGFIYAATTANTIGVDPVDDDGTFWTRGAAAAWSMVSPTLYTASAKWNPIYSDMTNVPGEWKYVGQGLRGNNVFRVPSGMMRKARVGYRMRLAPDDVEPHGDYLTSAEAILLLEFVASIRDVRKMDTLFCEGLAVRLALSTCKKLTGSDSSLSTLASEYNKFMGEARIINGIEMGPEEADEDEYINVRAGSGSGAYSSASTNWWGS